MRIPNYFRCFFGHDDQTIGNLLPVNMCRSCGQLAPLVCQTPEYRVFVRSTEAVIDAFEQFKLALAELAQLVSAQITPIFFTLGEALARTDLDRFDTVDAILDEWNRQRLEEAEYGDD